MAKLFCRNARKGESRKDCEVRQGQEKLQDNNCSKSIGARRGIQEAANEVQVLPARGPSGDPADSQEGPFQSQSTVRQSQRMQACHIKQPFSYQYCEHAFSTSTHRVWLLGGLK